jgi:small subunit ribosomal protein S1
VQVGDEIFVKIIDIDLDRRRISLSLKQANEGTIGEAVGDEFDPTLYGMPATYDEQGEYVYPEGFDAETGEWLEGFDKQREEWERQYAQARSRFEAHRRQVEESRKGDEGDAGDAGDGADVPPPDSDDDSGVATGALASDEALAALRDKLSGGGGQD